MKKRWNFLKRAGTIALTFMMLLPSYASVHASTPESKIVDLSHSNPNSWGFTLGTKDEIKRWQTFTSPGNGVLNQAGFFLREKAGEGSLTNLVVELFATKDNKPTGEPLKVVSVNPASVVFDEELKVDIDYKDLEQGKKYALALTQETLSQDGGLHNYSWPTKEVNSNEYFGKFAGGNWVDESFLGDGWLKVYTTVSKAESNQIKSIEVSPKYINLRTGETTTVKVKALNEYGEEINNPALSWSIDNEKVAKVDNGVVTAVEEGTATLIATSGDITQRAIVTVSNAEGVVPTPGMIITQNTVLKPGIYDFSTGGGITLDSDNITLDGNGAILVGPGEESKGPDSFQGTGIYSDGKSGITLKNIEAKGFQYGLLVKNGSKWTITNNDFSNNYTNPDFGWGDGEAYSAVMLDHVTGSTIANNKGNNVWNGLNLHHSDRNKVEKNDFSHTSNVSLKMWHASENTISDNNFSYGIRIDPGETHARDSTSLLMETGSNNNKLYRNDFTHGGDGIFIRVLNGWVSTGNYFEENDASYANNNAIESWSPGNTYVRNKANHSSYGFWLGGSDDTVLRENEAAFNGTNIQNAPEAFGNAGIAVVNGASSHFTMIGNDVHDNNGPGVAIRYNVDYPAYHWVIQQNKIYNNQNDPRGYKGYGIYMKNAEWLDIAGNQITNNDSDAIKIDSNVSDVFQREASMDDKAPQAKATVSSRSIEVGDIVTFDASGSNDPNGGRLGYRWDLGDGNIEGSPVVSHKYEKPGFYRVGLTVNNGKLSDLSYINVYVTEKGTEIGTDDTANWEISSQGATVKKDKSNAIKGDASISVTAGSGTNHTLLYPKGKNLQLDASDKNMLSFWFKFNGEDGRQDWNKKPIVQLYQDENNYLTFTPSTAYLEQLFAPISEQRSGWRELEIPLSGNKEWTVEKHGSPSMKAINYLTIDEGPGVSGISEFWIDALQITNRSQTVDASVNVAANKDKTGYPKPIYSYSSADGSEWAPLQGNHSFDGGLTPKWSSYHADGSKVRDDWYGVDFGTKRDVNRLDVYFYQNPSGTESKDYLWKPDNYQVEYWDGAHWKPVLHPAKDSDKPNGNLNRITFDMIQTSKLRVVVTHHVGNVIPTYTAIYGFEAYNTNNVAGNSFGESVPVVAASSSISQNITLEDVGILINRKGTDPDTVSDVVVELYETKDNKPVGDAVSKVKVEKSKINLGIETKVKFDYEGLKPGHQYAIAITQEVIAPDGSYDHYRWPTKQIGVSEKFGKYVDGSWVDESFLGTGWLKLYTSKGLIDYSFENPSKGGYGVGHSGEQKRWQTFSVPADRIWQTIDGSVKEENGWSTLGSKSKEDWVQLDFSKEKLIYDTNLFFNESDSDSKLPENFSFQYWDGEKWRNVETLYADSNIHKGFNQLIFKPVRTNKVRVLLNHDLTTKVELKEFEVLQLNPYDREQLDQLVLFGKDTGEISHEGTIKSLLAKVTKMQKSENRQDYLGALKALKNEINAQFGKKISEKYAAIMQAHLDYLSH
ncbi:MAG: right-handed parallel beta-helix repeat-containing protein [Bacillus sp. (in: firmicutes)]